MKRLMFFGGALLMLTALGASGQEQASVDNSGVMTVKPGTVFEAYGPWQVVQLSATSLVNPKAAQSSPVVYSYDADVLKNPDVLGLSFVLAQKAGPNRYVALNDVAAAKVISEIKSGSTPSWSLSDGIKVLAKDKLDGTTNSNLMIGWAQ